MRSLVMISLPSLAVASASILRARQSSREPSELGEFGFGKPGGLSGSFPPSTAARIDELFLNAGREANDTGSASASFPLGSSNASWTWTVNVTDVTVPDDILSGNVHVVNEQWSLSWPNGGSLQSVVDRTADPGTPLNDTQLCVSSLTFSLPSNITSRYSESEPGDCSSVLGSACAEQMAFRGTAGDCSYFDVRFWNSIPECNDNVLYSNGARADTSYSYNTASLQSGETFYFDTSRPVSASNVSDRYNEAATRLNILLLRNFPGQPSTAMSCQVVNPPTTGGASTNAMLSAHMLWVMVIAMVCGSVL